LRISIRRPRVTLYLETLSRLREAFAQYRRRAIGIDQLQSLIWDSAEQIASPEEKELRRALQNAEAKLDLLRFTLDRDLVFEQSLAVIEELGNDLAEWE